MNINIIKEVNVNHPIFLPRPMHGEGLATASLAICKYSRVEPTDRCLYQRTYCCCVYTPGVILGAVHSVKGPPKPTVWLRIDI